MYSTGTRGNVNDMPNDSDSCRFKQCVCVLLLCQRFSSDSVVAGGWTDVMGARISVSSLPNDPFTGIIFCLHICGFLATAYVYAHNDIDNTCIVYTCVS